MLRNPRKCISFRPWSVVEMSALSSAMTHFAPIKSDFQIQAFALFVSLIMFSVYKCEVTASKFRHSRYLLVLRYGASRLDRLCQGFSSLQRKTMSSIRAHVAFCMRGTGAELAWN